MRELRDYQQKSLGGIYQAWADKLKPLLVLPPGAGKSLTVSRLTRQVQGVYCVNLAVKTRGLVGQLEESVRAEGIDYGVYMANHPKFNPNARVQVCSIDTLRSRQDYPHINQEKVILFIDEADESKSPSFQNWINAYPQALLGGMTATPYNGLSHFNKIIAPIGAKELLDRGGILVPFRYFQPKDAIDMSGARIENGEYNQKDIYLKTSTVPSLTSAVRAWDTWGEHRLTLMYGSSVEHSKALVDRFNNHYGYPLAVHCDANTPKDVVAKTIADFKTGKIKILSNVGLFIRGTDIPEIGCVLDVAPTAMMNRHVQKLGRGARWNTIYPDCIWIDCAKNCSTLGGYYMDRSNLINLNKATTFRASDLVDRELMFRCEKCFGCFEPSEVIKRTCPRCMHVTAPKARTVKQSKDVAFEEVNERVLAQQMIIKEYKKLFWQRLNLPMYDKRFKKDKSKINFEVNKILFKRYGTACFEVAKAINMKVKDFGG